MKVVHCKKEPYDVYIGRTCGPFKDLGWGNPFIVGRDGDRWYCIQKYKEYILRNEELLRRIPELRQKTLSCWCKPTYDCHGDILVWLANLSDEELNKLIKKASISMT